MSLHEKSFITTGPGLEIIKTFFMLYSTQLSMEFILLINVKMSTIIFVGILTFMLKMNVKIFMSFNSKKSQLPERGIDVDDAPASAC